MSAGFEVCEQLCQRLEDIVRPQMPNAAVHVRWTIGERGRRYIITVRQANIPKPRYAETALLAWLHVCYPQLRELDLQIVVQA